MDRRDFEDVFLYACIKSAVTPCNRSYSEAVRVRKLRKALNFDLLEVYVENARREAVKDRENG